MWARAAWAAVSSRDAYGREPVSIRPHSSKLAVALVSEFTALCTNPKAPLVAGLGWIVCVTALGSAVGAGSVANGLIVVALALFAI
jgi:hypothetical protein